MINYGLLKLSRLGRAALTIVPLDMGNMVDEIVRTMEYQLQEHNVKVEVGSLPACQGDFMQISQVFSNLLGNAFKYRADDRPGVIRVSGQIEQGRVVYCVEDNGLGIAPKHQQRVFELFHRLDPDGAAGGEGLGLSIVKRVLDRHQGEIRLESELGKGSRFYVSLPIPGQP